MSAFRTEAARRRKRRAAWAAHLRQAAPPDDLAFDPMSQRRRPGLTELLVLLPLAICAAVGAHVIFTVAVWGAGSLLNTVAPRPEDDTVTVAVIEEPPEPEIEAEAEPEPEPEPEPELKPKPEPETEPKPEPKPEPEPEPQAKPPAAPPKKIVGLDLGSTVAGGSGPAFATGSDLRGRTDQTATDPAQASREPEPEVEKDPPRVNRKATRIPRRGVTLVKPRRSAPVKPKYPPKLRAQAIEANVVVEVRLDRTGKVAEARIIKASPYPEMNREALAAARKERFTPATRDGKPIEYTLSYTVRFRLSDS